MKKITTLLLSCLMALTAFNAGAVNASIYEIDEGSLVGDVNNDNAVNVSDVTEIVNMILGIIPKNMDSADIDNNGQVNVSDVTALINIILGTTSGGSTGGSVITMADFTPNSGTTSGTAPLHQWAEGDVIFIAVDPDYTSACQNVYAMVRTGGKWVFRDVKGSNKQGFKTSGGTLCAAYVQHADLENSYYDYIPLKGDVACVNRAANYTVTPKNGKFYIKINDIILYHFVSRIDVYAANEGDYFYGSVTHLDALTEIRWQPFYTYASFQTSSRAPVIDIDSQHRGHAYGVWKKGTRTDGWLTLNYAKSNGYAYWWNYTQDELSQGRYLTSIYSPWQNGWNRDLYMNYYNGDERKSYRLNAGSLSAQQVDINVGTNIIFRPWDGATSDDKGTMTSVTSSNSGIIDVNYDNTQVNVTAHKVGTTTLTIKFKTKDGINTTYTYNVTVNPTVWAAGKSAYNKPILWRNWQDKSGWISGNSDNENYKATNIIVRGSTAFLMIRRDNVAQYTDFRSCTASIYKATGAHDGGVFNIYKGNIQGTSKQYCNYGTLTSYIKAVPRMWVDKDCNVYYTWATRLENTNDYDGYINTDIYKNKTKLQTTIKCVVNDITTDNTGKIFMTGINSDYYHPDYSTLYYSIGYFCIIDANNNLSYIPRSHWAMEQLFAKDGDVYVNSIGYYDYGYSQFINLFLRYNATSGLQNYTGTTGSNGFSMQSDYPYLGNMTELKPFIFEGNKFYYYGKSIGNGLIRTYQLGASETALYNAYPDSTEPLDFDIKNGYIGIALNAGSSNKRKVMSSKLNTVGEAYELENSVGATIYDVWLQTSLDD